MNRAKERGRECGERGDGRRETEMGEMRERLCACVCVCACVRACVRAYALTHAYILSKITLKHVLGMN